MTRIVLAAAAIVLSLLTATTDAAVVTVYGVQAPLATPSRSNTVSRAQPSVDWAGTQTASAIGPGESGRTKYEVKYIQSRLVVHHTGIDPQTIVSEPVTATYTHEQGGNILIEKGDPSISTISGGGTIDQTGLNVECTLDDERKFGVCAGENLYAVLTEVVSGTQTVLSTVTQTLGTTFTGSVFPIATLTTSSSGSMSSTRSTAFLVGTVVLGAFVAF